MPAMQVLNGFAVNPSSTITALTPCTGDSYTVRNVAQGTDVELLDAWAFTTTNLLFRYRSPLLHDAVQNARLKPTASQATPLLSGFATQKLQPQDNLIVELTGGTSETDVGSLLVYYDNLPGTNARLHQWSEIKPLVEEITTVEVDVTSNATAGQYSAAVAMNATFDTLKRNIDYAVLGYECPINGCSFGLSGVDTGNLRVGGPLTTLSFLTRGWFVDLSARTGKPCIPVINSANVAGVNIDVVAAATSTSFPIGIVLAQLNGPNVLS